MNCKKSLWKLITLLLACMIVIASAVPIFAEEEGEAGTSDKADYAQVLFISSYAYDWDSVPYQLNGVASVLKTEAKMEYVFMDTKKHTYDQVKSSVYNQIAELIKVNGQYDTIILEDDSALDFALEYRNKLFKGVPMVFMGINTQDKAELAHKDPLITGMVEFFPYYDTIDLAQKLYPNATKIIGITDNTQSGKGCSERFYAEEDNFPGLEFSEINASELTEKELEQQLSSVGDDTILVFLALVNDKDGNIYSLLEATDFVEKNASVPVFKADMLGIGEGILGGYVSSYEEMGKSAAKQVLQILKGTSPADIPVDTMGGYPMFDQNMIEKYDVDESLIPANSEILNYVPSYYEEYKNVIWPAAAIIIVLVIVGSLIIMINHKKQALSAAEKASKSKSDFLARMSHEIRTPMNAIIGETTIAQKNLYTPDKVNECLNKLLISARHLLSLINDILDMSAIESDKIKIAKARFDVKEIVSTITTLYYSQCNDKGIIFDSKVENMGLEFLIGDQLRIQQVILNLLSNAWKFTEPKGTIKFLIKEEIEDNNVNLHIMVKDSGCGMNKEYMDRIFKPFEQESALTAKEHGGSGLGLSISKNLVELMGGEMHVESEVNVGTTFTVDIPVVAANDQVQMNADAVTHLRALVVDDDATARDYTGSILNHIGIVHDEAANGEEALKIITKARNDHEMYDVCLLDWKMPGLTGVELTKKIRQTCGETPIIIIASAYDVSEITKGIEEGANACIEKPLFQSTLFNVLMSASNGKLVNETADSDDYDFTGKKILLVDDNELNREIATELLEMVGFTVDTAEDGKQSLDMFTEAEAGTYDVILMDVQMPVMNGYDAAEAIRNCNHPQSEEIPIIAMTANAFAEDIAASLKCGMNDHLTKPIDTELMYEVLMRNIK